MKLDETVIQSSGTSFERPIDIINITGTNLTATADGSKAVIGTQRKVVLYTYPFTAGISTGQIIYFPFFNEQGSTTTAPTDASFTKRQYLGAGILSNLFGAARKDSGATSTVTCTIYKNGVSTGLTVTFNVTSPNWATGINSSDTLEITANDWITIMATSVTQGINQLMVRCHFLPT